MICLVYRVFFFVVFLLFFVFVVALSLSIFQLLASTETNFTYEFAAGWECHQAHFICILFRAIVFVFVLVLLLLSLSSWFFFAISSALFPAHLTRSAFIFIAYTFSLTHFNRLFYSMCAAAAAAVWFSALSFIVNVVLFDSFFSSYFFPRETRVFVIVALDSIRFAQHSLRLIVCSTAVRSHCQRQCSTITRTRTHPNFPVLSRSLLRKIMNNGCFGHCRPTNILLAVVCMCANHKNPFFSFLGSWAMKFMLCVVCVILLSVLVPNFSRLVPRQLHDLSRFSFSEQNLMFSLRTLTYNNVSPKYPEKGEKLFSL